MAAGPTLTGHVHTLNHFTCGTYVTLSYIRVRKYTNPLIPKCRMPCMFYSHVKLHVYTYLHIYTVIYRTHNCEKPSFTHT